MSGKRNWVVAMSAILLVLSGCGSSDSDEPPATPEPPAAPEVDWENYAPAVQTRIDDAAAAKDCTTLQSEFDTAEANSDHQRERTGDSNTDLMAYIDFQMEQAGCYATPSG